MGNIKDKLKDEIQIAEACLTGIFWNNPSLYDIYNDDKINRHTFLNEVWGFYFGLGRYMRQQGVSVFDDITTYNYVKSLDIEDKYDYYNGYKTIKEVMDEVEDKSENMEGYYEEVKKYELIVSLIKLFGEKVVTNTDKYDYKKMTKDQLYIYWHDKLNNIGISSDISYDEKYLLEGLEDMIDEWDENPVQGLPFYQSRQMNRICPGLAQGNVYIFGSNSGRGKTSMTINKLILSAIENQEKMLVIANEMDLKMYQQLLLITAMGVGTNAKFERSKIQRGNYTEEQKKKLKNAAKWVKNLCSGNDKLITFIFMNNYIIDDVEKIIRYYAARGVKYVIIDTSKVSQGVNSEQRWASFGDDYRKLYELAREDGGGLNLGIWTTVQLSPAALKQRFLNEHALAEFKGITREASVVMLMRNVWADEHQGEKNALNVTSYEKSPTGDGYVKNTFDLPKQDKNGNDMHYHLIFTVKNRLGTDQNSGQEMLVLQPNFNYNTWKEVGWTWVFDDKNY